MRPAPHPLPVDPHTLFCASCDEAVELEPRDHGACPMCNTVLDHDAWLAWDDEQIASLVGWNGGRPSYRDDGDYEPAAIRSAA